MRYQIKFVPGLLAQTTNHEEAGLPGAVEFATAQEVSAYVSTYIDDDFEEAQGNVNCPAEPAVWRAFGELYAGLAQGGDFSITWWGDTISVEMQYHGIEELLGSWAAAELAAALCDPEGPNMNDIAQVVEKLTMALPSFGDAQGTWRMKVVANQDEPDADFVPSNASVFVPYYVNGNRVQWPCALGVATVWAE